MEKEAIPLDDTLHQAQDRLILALGRQSAFWGLGRAAGEMYAALYLSARPLSLEELAARLQVTKGAISVAIRQLEHLHMVKRTQHKGDRRVFFEAETDFWRIGHAFLKLRHQPEFADSFALVEECARLTEAAPPSPDRELAKERIESLQSFYGQLDGLVETLLAMDPDQMEQMLQLVRMLRQGKEHA